MKIIVEKVLPFLKDDYFVNRTDKILFHQIYDFVNKYNNLHKRNLDYRIRQ